MAEAATLSPVDLATPAAGANPVRNSGDAEQAATVAALQRLLAWLSPSFPVGAYSYSHGLEWAIEDGTVTSPAGLEAWIADILRHGAGRSDAILLAHAHRAAAADDVPALRAVAELAAAFQPSRERHLEATAQGRAFLTTVGNAWPNQPLAALALTFPADTAIAYPVAVGLAAAAHDVPLDLTLPAYLGAFAANLVSAGVRAVPIGQTDGQRIIATLQPIVAEMAGMALAQPLEALGGAALRADIASLRHETQYTRLFRS